MKWFLILLLTQTPVISCFFILILLIYSLIKFHRFQFGESAMQQKKNRFIEHDRLQHGIPSAKISSTQKGHQTSSFKRKHGFLATFYDVPIPKKYGIWLYSFKGHHVELHQSVGCFSTPPTNPKQRWPLRHFAVAIFPQEHIGSMGPTVYLPIIYHKKIN